VVHDELRTKMSSNL